MVEFAVVAVVLFLFVGAATDLGLAMYKRSLLTKATIYVSRKASLRSLSEGISVSTAVTQEANHYLQNGLLIDPSQIGTNVTFSHEVNGTPPRLKVTMRWRVGCFLLCTILPEDYTVEVSGEAMMV